MEVPGCPSAVSVVGSGEMSRAIATRLYDVGISVCIGSRFPSKRISDVPNGDILAKVKVTTIEDCIKASDVIILCLHPEHHNTLKQFESMMVGKIVVDCSNSYHVNPKSRSTKESNAQKLATLFPESNIVKAFNSVSAFAMETMYENRPTHVCGDDLHSKQVVMQLATRLGLFPIDFGCLQFTERIEESNQKLLPGWGKPTVVMTIVSVVWLVYTICRHYVMRKDPYTWDMFPTYVLNKTVSAVAITLLALSYLPGSLTACTQLVNGTKHKRFHWALDKWLLMRKQLGFYALVFGVMHGIMSVALLSPANYSTWFHANKVVIPGNLTQDMTIALDSRMNWIGESCVLLGILAVLSMTIVGITSINSIANSLNWREWQCMQSYLGLVCLILATGHTTVKGAPRWAGETWGNILQGMTFLSSLLPWFTLALRLVLLTPCIYVRVKKIRRGRERGVGEPSDDIIEMLPSFQTLEEDKANGIGDI